MQSLYPNMTDDLFMSVYTPTVTYACSLSGEQGKPDCYNLSQSPLFIVFLILGGVSGLFLALFGHRFFRMQFVVLSWLAFTCLIYLLLSMECASLFSDTSLIITSVLGGFFLASCVYLFWYWFDALTSILILNSSILGALMAAFLLATPLGNLTLLQNNFNYLMCFVCTLLTFPVVFLLYGRFLSITCSSVVGSYFVLLVVDYFIGTDLNEIVDNVYKRATIPLFATSYEGSIFSTSNFNGCVNFNLNVMMASLWLGLSLVFGLIQHYYTGFNLDLPISPKFERNYTNSNENSALARYRKWHTMRNINVRTSVSDTWYLIRQPIKGWS